MPENYITSETEKGNISISEDVIQVMVSAAVSEIEGVAGLFVRARRGHRRVPRHQERDHAAECEDRRGERTGLSSSILIMVRYGYGVTVVAKKVQDQVAVSVEDMTGLKTVVNVHITGIAFDKTDMKG